MFSFMKKTIRIIKSAFKKRKGNAQRKAKGKPKREAPKTTKHHAQVTRDRRDLRLPVTCKEIRAMRVPDAGTPV